MSEPVPPETQPATPATTGAPAASAASTPIENHQSKIENAKPRGALGYLWQEWVRPLGTVLLVLIVVRSSLIDWNDVPSGSMNPTILEGDRIVVNKLAYGINAPVNGPVIDLPFVPAFDNPLSFLPRYLWSKPQRGDIVTFWNPVEGIRMVKRVVAVPGDTVEVVNGRLRITDAEGHDVPVRYDPIDTGTPRVATLHSRSGQTAVVELQDFVEHLGGTDHAVQLTPRFPNLRDSPAVTLHDDPDDLSACEYFLIGDNRDNSKDSRAYEQEGVRVRGEHITGKALFIALSFDGSFLKPRFGRLFRGFDGPTLEDLRDGGLR